MKSQSLIGSLMFACVVAVATVYSSLMAAESPAGSPQEQKAKVSAERPKAAKTVRLLTVGNSFSRNATNYLDELAEAAGNELIHHQAAIGGGTLAQHCEKAEIHAKDPQDPRGLYTTKKSLVEELRAEPWDFITIQQASIRSHDVSTYRPYARQLYEFIKQYAPRSEVVMHQTWAYRCDDPRFGSKPREPGEPATREEMYRELTAAYGTIAAELGLRIIPVGDAFNLADSDATWGYKPDRSFDLQTARHPHLPDQTHSLHTGWRWSKQQNGQMKLGMDGHHANAAGQYLGACVFYEFLFDQSVVGNAFRPEEVDPDYARFLQETAHRAVENRRGR